MEEKPSRKFYPTYLLLVIGFGFLLFTLLSSLVEGENFKLFGWLGLTAVILGLLTGIATILIRAHRKNKTRFVP